MIENTGKQLRNPVRNLALPLMTYLEGPRQIALGGFLWPVSLSKETGSFSFSVAMTAIGGDLCYAAMACLFVFCVIHEFLVGRYLIFVLEQWTSWEQSPYLQHNPGTQLTFKASELLLPQPTWSLPKCPCDLSPLLAPRHAASLTTYPK